MGKNIVILTGAGISAQSGLKTFRDSGGLWEGHRVEDVATPEAYEKNPDLVNKFYNARRAQLSEVEPNLAHLALAKLSNEYSGNVLIVTQNVDNLHEKAAQIIAGGTQYKNNILHMHGELLSARCTITGHNTPWYEDILPDTRSPFDMSGTLRPDIVWFGEMPKYMDEIYSSLKNCDIFVSIGTSGNVYPAAGFVAECRNKRTIELNLEPSIGASMFKEAIYGPASEIVPKFVEELINDF